MQEGFYTFLASESRTPALRYTHFYSQTTSILRACARAGALEQYTFSLPPEWREVRLNWFELLEAFLDSNFYGSDLCQQRKKWQLLPT